MKRTLRQNVNNFNNSKNENGATNQSNGQKQFAQNNNINNFKNFDAKNLNQDQAKQFEKLKNMAKGYEGKSESEILKDLAGAVKKGKSDGTLTDEKINSIASSIAPMLNSEQKAKLELLMRTLKK